MLSDWFFLIDLHRERHRDFGRWAEAERLRRSVRPPKRGRRQAPAEPGGTTQRPHPLAGLNAALRA